MEVIHTLLFMIRESSTQEDLAKIEKCLRSLEKSTYKTVVVYNQGFWNNQQVYAYMSQFALDGVIMGDGTNQGIVVGRQKSFEYIWADMPTAKFISEVHVDMIFSSHWEDPLVDYLNQHDEPVISCGIVDKERTLYFLNEKAPEIPSQFEAMEDYLKKLRRDRIVEGFTHPCIHKAEVLKAVGGYDTRFLTGRQAFEDDSLLLGYHYYYGTRANWRPKINYNAMVYHEIAGQRFGVQGNVMQNFNGMLVQYGAMGLQRLSQIHRSPWHIRFFNGHFERLASQSSK